MAQAACLIGDTKFCGTQIFLEGFDNVGALVPMGNIASMNRGNPLELRLEAWRKSINTETPVERKMRVNQLKAAVEDLKRDLERQYELTDQERQAELKAPINN